MQANCPDTESRKFKQEVEAKKLKFKGTKNSFCLMPKSRITIHLHVFDAIKKGEHAEAQKPVETFLELIRKRPKRIS